MIENIILVAAFWILYFAILTIIYIIKEKLALQPKPFGILDQPPFDCRYCLTVWTMVGSYVSIAIIISNFWFGFFGLILAFGEYLALDYKKKQLITDN